MRNTHSVMVLALLFAPLSAANAVQVVDDPELKTWVDEEHKEFVVTGGPFHLPAGTMSPDMMAGEHDSGGHSHDESARTPMMKVEWPIEGFMEGWKMRLYEPDGTEVPQEILHHFVGVNFDRRQLVYPVVERFLAVGQETADVELPALVGLPLEKGTELGFYAMWSNTLGRDLDVYFELRLPYSETAPALSVLPIYLDVNNVIGESSTYDLPPGESLKEFEFEVPVEGSLLIVGGHLHDYGKWVRLENAETGEVLVQIDADFDESGQVSGMEREILGFGENALYMRPGKKYRLVARYVNPTNHLMPDAAMGHMMGAFAPADYSRWPGVDRDSEVYRIDLTGLPPSEIREGGSQGYSHD
jgi:hypothetical protein